VPEFNQWEACHGQSKATLGGAKEHQKGRACGKTKTNSKAFAEKDTASARATSRKGQKVTTVNVVVTNRGIVQNARILVTPEIAAF
jgi:hypothetical protein